MTEALVATRDCTTGGPPRRLMRLELAPDWSKWYWRVRSRAQGRVTKRIVPTAVKPFLQNSQNHLVCWFEAGL